MIYVEFYQDIEPEVQKPIVIAAMQDMGHVGTIVIDFINKHLQSKAFRTASCSLPGYVVDNGGYIGWVTEEWQYRYTGNLILFGGNANQPQNANELHEACQDVVDIALKYDAKFIYTVGGFLTQELIQGPPQTFVTATTKPLSEQLQKAGFTLSSQRSFITGFNGLVLGYAMANNVSGIGLYGELNDPTIPQYRTAKSIIQTLQKLTFQNMGDTTDLDVLAAAEDRMARRRQPEFHG